MNVVLSLGRAVWSIDGCHEALVNASKHKSVSPLPEVWNRFTGYFDPHCGKKGEQMLDSRVLKEIKRKVYKRH